MTSTSKTTTTTQKSKLHHNDFPVEITDNPHTIVWYEMTWLCSVTLVMSAVALVSNRPLLAWAHGLAVAIDQVLWYFDGVVYLTTGFKKTVVGVFNHILLVQTPWYYHLTTWHHIWTLPILGLATSSLSSSAAAAAAITTTNQSINHFLEQWDVDQSYGCYLQIWFLSGAIMTFNVLSSRVWTPYGLLLPKRPLSLSSSDNDNSKRQRHQDDDYHFHYLNVNLAYEVWRELSMNIAFLRIQHDAPSVPVYMGRLLTRWFLLNTLILVSFLSLWKLCATIIIAG